MWKFTLLLTTCLEPCWKAQVGVTSSGPVVEACRGGGREEEAARVGPGRQTPVNK